MLLMKNYKFKLESILKIKNFEKKKAQQEINMIVSKMAVEKEQYKSAMEEIDYCYQLQEEAMQMKISARKWSLYPNLFEAGKRYAQRIKNNIGELDKNYKEKIKKLTKAMGEVKMIENIKEKDKKIFKKQKEKKEQMSTEELLQYKRMREIR